MKDCYKLSKEFASFLSERLRCIFPTVFELLEKIKEAEGFLSNEASIEMSPFISFTVTSDYNCKPHIDKDGYDLGFIIWIQEDWWLNLLLFFVLKFFCRILHCLFQLLNVVLFCRRRSRRELSSRVCVSRSQIKILSLPQ